MRPDSLLHRQVHRTWHQDGKLSSLTFQPSRGENKDHQVSVDDGDQISAEDSYRHHRYKKNYDTVGVVAVTPQECGLHGVTVTPDPEPDHDPHTLLKLDPALGKRKIRRIAQFLTGYASRRGWQHGPIARCDDDQDV